MSLALTAKQLNRYEDYPWVFPKRISLSLPEAKKQAASLLAIKPLPDLNSPDKGLYASVESLVPLDQVSSWLKELVQSRQLMNYKEVWHVVDTPELRTMYFYGIPFMTRCAKTGLIDCIYSDARALMPPRLMAKLKMQVASMWLDAALQEEFNVGYDLCAVPADKYYWLSTDYIWLSKAKSKLWRVPNPPAGLKSPLAPSLKAFLALSFYLSKKLVPAIPPKALAAMATRTLRKQMLDNPLAVLTAKASSKGSSFELTEYNLVVKHKDLYLKALSDSPQHLVLLHALAQDSPTLDEVSLWDAYVQLRTTLRKAEALSKQDWKFLISQPVAQLKRSIAKNPVDDYVHDDNLTSRVALAAKTAKWTRELGAESIGWQYRSRLFVSYANHRISSMIANPDLAVVKCIKFLMAANTSKPSTSRTKQSAARKAAQAAVTSQQNIAQWYRVQDYAVNGIAPNLNGSWPVLCARAARWHEELHAADNATRIAKAKEVDLILAKKYSDRASGEGGWATSLAPCSIHGIAVKELTSALMLEHEGSEMHHCVASFAEKGWSGESRLFSLISEEDPACRTTLELTNRGNSWSVAQHYGYDNELPAPSHSAVVPALIALMTDT